MKKLLFVLLFFVGSESFGFCGQSEADLNFNRVLASSRTASSRAAPPSDKIVRESKLNMQTCLQKKNRNYYCRLRGLYSQFQGNDHYKDILPFINNLLMQYGHLYAGYNCSSYTQTSLSY